MSRPYFSYSGQQLLELFEKSGQDRAALELLRDELKHRTAHSMRGLLMEVEEALAGLGATPGPSRPKERAKTAGAGEPPSGPKRGTIRACSPSLKVPDRWVPPEQRTITIEGSAADRVNWYGNALRALIADLRKNHKGVRMVPLRDGVAVPLDGAEKGYRFPYEGEGDVFEGAKVVMVISGRQIDGRIVSIDGRGLTLSLAEDLGDSIPACQLKIDNTAMIEALAERLEKVGSGETKLNKDLAEAVLTNKGAEQHPGTVPGAAHLNKLQREAVGRILTNEVTYLWGPPGTGKTATLSVANELLFQAGKRILVCSNTNQAVDQVLYKLCKGWGVAHPALAEGKVLRLGQIHLEALTREYQPYVTLAGIVARKSESLQKRLAELDGQIARVRRGADKARALLVRFAALDELEKSWPAQRDRLAGLQAEWQRATATVEGRSSAIRKLEEELQAWRAAGALKRLMMRKEAAILADLAKVRADADRAAASLPELDAQLKQTNASAARLEQELLVARAELAVHDRAAAQRAVDEVEEALHPLLSEVTTIKAQLADMEKAVLKDARIIGATVTKCFLSPQTFADFDVVIVDEASMVMLPALYYVAGLAKEKVVISGDFRQLSPIVQTEEAAIRDAIGADIFTTAGIADAFGKRQPLKRTIMLAEQYRMAEPICRLISPRMYDRRLVTGQRDPRKAPCPPAPYEGVLTIVDTTPLQPFTHLDGGSRFNLMNALVIRNLARCFREDGFAAEAGRLGVCTPYAAQAKLVRRLMESSGLADRVEVGTVHRYQGDEKTAMIIDIPDSLGEKRMVGMFAQAETPDDDGAKLFNVAVSRSQEHLVFVGNLDYLDAKLPANAFLRELLYETQEKGRVLDAREVLALWPIAEDLRKLGTGIELDPSAVQSGMFRQNDFDAVFAADVEAARQGVAIFSGFITPQRVASYERLFRLKLAQGVAIRCVTRPPQRNGSIPPEQGAQALKALEAMGCVVDTRWDMHEKIAIIDDEVVWTGSLNPLSHSGRTDEIMLRFTGRPAALQIAAFMTAAGGANPDRAAGTLYARENPACPDCGARSTLRKGQYGPYWQCESECGWKEGLSKPRHKNSGEKSQEAPCPKCGKPMAQRNGRFGSFLSCTDYPRCKGTR